MAKADELYSEYIPDVDMEKVGKDEQTTNTIVNLTSDLVAARTLTKRQVGNLMRILRRNKERVNNAVKTLKQRMKQVTTEKIAAQRGNTKEKGNLSAK